VNSKYELIVAIGALTRQSNYEEEEEEEERGGH
jgi:DNA-directed RNA polymerase subunit K/omega